MSLDRPSALVAAALVVGMAVFGTVAFAGSAAAASNGSLAADPAEPGAESTHTATLTVGTEATGSWNGFAVDYAETDANVSNVGQGDVVHIGIDRGDDADGDTVDVNVSDDLSGVSASNNGETLSLTLGGSYSLNESDEVVVVYEGVTNPSSEGEYEVPLDVNPQSSGGEGAATLAIGSDGLLDTGDDSSEETTTTTEENTQESDADDSDSDTTEESGASANVSADAEASGGTPGFGVAAALVALLAAGALFARREN